MKAVEFETTITPEGEIAIPREIAGEIPAGEQLRVVVMWIYERLIGDTAAR